MGIRIFQGISIKLNNSTFENLSIDVGGCYAHYNCSYKATDLKLL